MKKNQTKATVNKNSKNFYAFGVYKPNKNAVPVNYKGTEYLSKAQCMALEGITRKELDAYLNGVEETVVMDSIPTPEEIAIEETVDAVEEDLKQDILADQAEESSLDSLLND